MRFGLDWNEPETAVISALKKTDALAVSEIITMSGLSRTAVSDVLRRLLEKGLIERTRPPKSPKQRYRLVVQHRENE